MMKLRSAPDRGALLELLRAPAALSVPGDTLAGAAAAGTLGARTIGLTAASVSLYLAGMAANGWADRDLDAVQRPERPIPSGRVAPETALRLAVALSVSGLAFAGLAGSRRALAVAVPLTGMVWAYDLAAKNTAAGPPTMAACRGLDVLLGAGTGRPGRAVRPALLVAAHTYTVTALSRHEVEGCDAWLPVATLAGTAATAMAAAMPEPRRGRGLRILPAILTAWYAARFATAQARAAGEPTPANLRGAVGAGITSLPALQGALAARHGVSAGALAVAAAMPLGHRLAEATAVT